MYDWIISVIVALVFVIVSGWIMSSCGKMFGVKKRGYLKSVSIVSLSILLTSPFLILLKGTSIGVFFIIGPVIWWIFLALSTRIFYKTEWKNSVSIAAIFLAIALALVLISLVLTEMNTQQIEESFIKENSELLE